mgnify:CR=1
MAEENKGAAKAQGQGGDAPAIKSSKRPLVIVNMTPGQIDFPLSSYSKIADAKGNTGHSIRYLRLMPGINFMDKAVVGKTRHDLTDEEYEALSKHPDYKRLRDASHVREYRSTGAIESVQRKDIVEISSDVSNMIRWKADADTTTKLAIDARLQELSDEGLTDDDRNVPEHIHRPGQSVVM